LADTEGNTFSQMGYCTYTMASGNSQVPYRL